MTTAPDVSFSYATVRRYLIGRLGTLRPRGGTRITTPAQTTPTAGNPS